MIRSLWRNGRLAWPPVALVVFSTLWVLAFDYAWRLIDTPFEILLITGLALWGLGVLVILFIGRRLR